MCGGGDDGLGPFAGVAAPDAVHVQARADTGALQGGEALLAGHAVDTEGFLVFLQVERRAAEHPALGAGEVDDVIVEARDGDVAVLVDQGVDHLAEGVDRVHDRAAVVTGVDILVRSRDADLHVLHAAHAGVDGRNLVGDHRGVGNENQVAGEFLAVGLHPCSQARGTDFLFALDHKLDVVAEFLLADQVFEHLDVHEVLALVVVRTAAPDGAVLDDRFVRLCVPELERFFRLDVIVAVDHDGGGLRIEFLLRKDHRVAGRLADLRRVDAGCLEQFYNLLRAAVHILLVDGIGADGRDAELLEELVEETFFVLLDVLFHFHNGMCFC